MQVIFKK